VYLELGRRLNPFLVIVIAPFVWETYEHRMGHEGAHDRRDQARQAEIIGGR
jgi:hypothetical protein